MADEITTESSIASQTYNIGISGSIYEQPTWEQTDPACNVQFELYLEENGVPRQLSNQET